MWYGVGGRRWIEGPVQISDEGVELNELFNLACCHCGQWETPKQGLPLSTTHSP